MGVPTGPAQCRAPEPVGVQGGGVGSVYHLWQAPCKPLWDPEVERCSRQIRQGGGLVQSQRSEGPSRSTCVTVRPPPSGRLPDAVPCKPRNRRRRKPRPRVNISTNRTQHRSRAHAVYKRVYKVTHTQNRHAHSRPRVPCTTHRHQCNVQTRHGVRGGTRDAPVANTSVHAHECTTHMNTHTTRCAAHVARV